MNKPLVALSALTISAVLTGCGSTPSLTSEDQVKLIEYENCLKLYIDQSNIVLESSTSSPLPPFGTTSKYRYNLKGFESVLKDCAQYRP
jgi:hypothetical protein